MSRRNGVLFFPINFESDGREMHSKNVYEQIAFNLQHTPSRRLNSWHFYSSLCYVLLPFIVRKNLDDSTQKNEQTEK